jgi:hypothetical protein
MIKHLLILILLLFPVLLQAQEMKNMAQLFDSLKTHPVTQGDDIRIEQALAGKSLANSKLYPNIDIFGRYDYATTATGMLPVPPNDLLAMVKDPSVAQPFSENIVRLGASVSMPIFVMSIFTMSSKAKLMVQSAQDLKQINLLKNEALLVGANSNLIYMQSLDSALTKKRNSLLKTKEFVEIKVKNGRAPESALLNINNGINQIDILINDLNIKKQEVIAMIQSITNIHLSEAVEMEQTGTFKDGNFLVLDPLRKKTEAELLGYRAEKQKLLPSVFLQGTYSNNSGIAYNNNKSVDNNYALISVVVKIPVFAKDQYAQIHKSHLDYEASANELEQKSLEISSQAIQLQNSLLLVENSIQLYQTSVSEKEQLLEIAKVSYLSDQMSTEDYLKYEDDVILEKSKLFKTQAEKWQTLMKLCVIYGNNIEGVVK